MVILKSNYFFFKGGNPFFSRYLFALISARVGGVTFLPIFFCIVFHIFVRIGLTILNMIGVAEAPAVAITANASALVA